MFRVTLRTTFAVVVLSAAIAAGAQQAAQTSPAKFTGCVQVSSGTVGCRSGTIDSAQIEVRKTRADGVAITYVNIADSTAKEYLPAAPH